MRERWGTFSVRDHMTDAPFVSDVLLYDRLVIPVPPTDKSQDKFWAKFKPQQQKACLDILVVKTPSRMVWHSQFPGTLPSASDSRTA